MKHSPAMLPWAVLAAGLVVGAARAEQPATRPAIVDAYRGISQVLEFRDSGPAIRATANQSRLSPVLVRIADVKAGPGNQKTYRVEFIGLMAGQYDLRDYLERQDGSSLNLAPLPVSVVSKLDAGHGTDLFSSPQVPLLGSFRYALVMWFLFGVWLSVPVIYLLVRLIRRQPPPPPPVVTPPPTLAEQLQPLAEAAIRGSLSLAQQARLELLMYLYWRERLGLQGPQAEIVWRLRRDEHAGGLLRAVESWLHSGRASSDHAAEDLARLLEPYRSARAIPLEANPPVLEPAR